MRFIANGDFNFPFDWIIYWMKHFYIWSFQSGTPNPDGLIRLPGRIFNFIAFGAGGNIGASYFYLLSTMLVCFAAFYFFSKHFLQVKNRSILLLGALFFACNPIFLGNWAKVGLVLAAAMLPLALLAIKAAFERQRVRYLMLWIVCINISFLHPYNFTVNLAISGLYLAYMAWKHRHFVLDHILKFAVVGVVAIGLNAYFVLPLKSMGTVSKDVISTNVTPSPIDYTALVGISNTGDFFTGFSLSKNVFKDFEFYNDAYQLIYFFGVFAFYVLLLWMYLRIERHISAIEKRRIALFFGAFLVFIALAATTVFHIDKVIEILIGLPGGWAFRSPLKWQLYIPLVLFSVLVILLSYLPVKSHLRAFQWGLLGTFVLMNGYLAVDVYRKILTPRPITTFQQLQELDTNQKHILFVNSNECMDFMRSNPRIVTEFNQIFTSKNTQLKHVLIDNADSINLGSYDYVIQCQTPLEPLLDLYDFTIKHRFAGGTFVLHQNNSAQDHVFTADTLFAIDDTQDVANKYNFAHDTLQKPFHFVTPDNDDYPVSKLQDAFAGLTPQSIRNGALTATLPGLPEGKAEENQRQLFFHDRASSSTPVFYRLDGSHLVLETEQNDQNGQAQQLNPKASVTLPANQDVQITYRQPGYDYKNLVSNPSFEEGLWRKKVSDCYRYDNQPAIAMRLDTRQASEGGQSLQLEAKRHIACTGPGEIDVQAGQHYLLSFDYQSLKGKYAGYYLSFNDDKSRPLLERIQKSGGSWQMFSKEIVVPEGATKLNLMLYAYPQSGGEVTNITRYDNVSLIRIPPAQDRFYLTSQPATQLTQPEQVKYTIVDPTKKVVHIRNATKPFYLVSRESHSDLWQLSSGEGKSWLPFGHSTVVPKDRHIQLNNTMNAWYIDPAQVCKKVSCSSNDTGHTFTLTMEFVPQRWFYFGLFISAATFVGAAGFFWWSHRRDKADGEGGWQWRR